MKPDLRRYVPDVARVLEESHPDKVKARRRKALEKLREEGLIERLTPEPAPEAAHVLEGATLPRALMSTDEPGPYEVPEAAPERAPHDAARARADAQRRRTRALFVGFAILAVVAPIAVLLAGRVREPRERSHATAASASAQIAASTLPATSAAPTVSATSNATANASATAAPSATMRVREPRASSGGPEPRASARGSDPYDDAPSSAKSAAPPSSSLPSPSATAAPRDVLPGGDNLNL